MCSIGVQPDTSPADCQDGIATSSPGKMFQSANRQPVLIIPDQKRHCLLAKPLGHFGCQKQSRHAKTHGGFC
jgi:hypothetical protein